MKSKGTANDGGTRRSAAARARVDDHVAATTQELCDMFEEASEAGSG
jgi:hypothetical protein